MKTNFTTRGISDNLIRRTVCAFLLLGGLLSSCTEGAVDRIFEEIDALEDTGSLTKLKGHWIRVESTNASSDNMIIKMTGTSGEIIDKAQSNFENGAIKWKEVEVVDSENYLHQELGSDGLYYEGTMKFGQDDTLRISVVANGAGTNQKWIKN